MTAIIWHKDSPDAGDPACTCSYTECQKVITEEQAPPIRMWDHLGREARFHMGCLMPAVRAEGREAPREIPVEVPARAGYERLQ